MRAHAVVQQDVAGSGRKRCKAVAVLCLTLMPWLQLLAVLQEMAARGVQLPVTLRSIAGHRAAVTARRMLRAGTCNVHTCFPQDHFRKSRKPSYTNVFHDRGGVVGVVEFETKEDLKAAIHDLDGGGDSGCCKQLCTH